MALPLLAFSSHSIGDCKPGGCGVRHDDEGVRATRAAAPIAPEEEVGGRDEELLVGSSGVRQHSSFGVLSASGVPFIFGDGGLSFLVIALAFLLITINCCLGVAARATPHAKR